MIYFKRIISDKGDFIVKYNLDITEYEDKEDILSDDIARGLLDLIANSKRYQNVESDEISWITYEDYVRFIRHFRLVNPTIPTPVEIDDTVSITNPYLSKEEKDCASRFLGCIINSEMKEDFVGLPTYTAVSEEPIEKKPEENEDDEKTDEERKKDTLKMQIEYFEGQEDYATAALYRQQLEVLNNSSDKTDEEKRKDALKRQIEYFEEQEDYYTASLYKQQLEELINPVNLQEEVQDDTVDFSGYIKDLDVKIQECLELNDYNLAAEYKLQRSILSTVSSLEPNKRRQFIEEKINQTGEDENYRDRAFWMQSLAIIESAKNKNL